MSATSKPSLAKHLSFPERSVLAQFAWISLFAAATAAGARFEIPHYPVPYTLQTLVVLLAGAFLGARNGAFSQLLYLAVGIIGAPVFASGGFGIARLIGPTGGYLLAFPVAAAVVGFMVEQRKSLPWLLASMATGLLVIFTSGTLHLFAFYTHDLGTAVSSGFLIFSWWDLLKLTAAVMIYREIAKRWPRLG
ncbi:MAG: biotin transporter BioY [Ignavibacteriae bacterium]|nr:biotin transporter BioY [Ignavibacteriota bacterium]